MPEQLIGLAFITDNFEGQNRVTLSRLFGPSKEGARR
jgi:hypothetical protein